MKNRVARKMYLYAALALVISPNLMATNFAGFEIQVNGTAAVIDSGNTLRVAPLVGGVGSAFITDPYPVDEDTSFSSYFQFRIGDGSGADGMVFVVQNDGDGAGASGGGGGGLGYNGVSPSIGVEMDEWTNGEWGDPNNNHIGIDVGGNPTSLSTYTPGVNIDSGNPYYLWVDYDGASNELAVFFNTSATKPGAPQLTETIDLFGEVGAQAYVGFVGSTGGANNNHDILDWTVQWASAAEPPPPFVYVPVPVMNGVAIAVLLMLIAVVARRYFNSRST